MRKTYTHLNSVNYAPNDYTSTLLSNSTSKYFWKNELIVTFMSYLQAILMTGARRIKYIVNYQNPIKSSND